MDKRFTALLVVVLSIVFVASLTLAACDKKGVHTFADKWSNDEIYHWRECTVADHTDIADKGKHSFVEKGANKTCSTCGYLVPFTEEETILYWIAARNATVGHEGAYTTVSKEKLTTDGSVTERNEEYETWDRGSNYLYTSMSSLPDSKGEFVKNEEKTDVLRPVMDGNTQRFKHFTKTVSLDKETSSYNTSVNATYVSPKYFNKKGVRLLPLELLDDLGVLEGNTPAELVADIKSYFEEDGGTVAISFLRNDNGSVTLNTIAEMKGQEEIDGLVADFEWRGTFALTAKDGKIVEYVVDTTDIAKFADASDKNYNESRHVEYEFSYSFDQEKFDAVDTATEDEPDNQYYSDYTITSLEYKYSWVFGSVALVGEKVLLSDIVDSFRGQASDFVDVAEGEVFFELYTDKEYTKPLTDYVATEEDYEFYVKFVAPEGRALVITMFRRQDDDGSTRDVFHIGYLLDVGERFFPDYYFRSRAILSIEGNTPGELTSFVCNESRIYVVVYSNTSGEERQMTHDKAVKEWSCDNQYHWHVCDDCGQRQLEKTEHDYETVDGKQTCKVCGYSTTE